MINPGGIYIHIPFCRNKCLYCDFYSGGLRIADWPVFLNAVFNELQYNKENINFYPTTLYIGGGTPSLIPPGQFADFIQKINELLEKKLWEEFTIEVNPEDVTKENIEVWKASGVNRISIGVQSFVDSELKSIGRKYDSNTARKALTLLKESFNNISADLMFGIPNQSLDSYRYSIHELLKFMPQHISSYSLMLEEGTAMNVLVNQNKIKLPEEEEWMKMFSLTVSELKKTGYRHYEISNYCREGYESRHNNSYWKGLPYLGLGPGAHSYDGNSSRRNNPNDIKGYVSYYSGNGKNNYGNPSFFNEEILSQEELREEYLLTRLRIMTGLSKLDFKRRFGENAEKNLLQKSRKYIRRGLMEEDSFSLRLTENGILLSDSILSDLI